MEISWTVSLGLRPHYISLSHGLIVAYEIIDIHT